MADETAEPPPGEPPLRPGRSSIFLLVLGVLFGFLVLRGMMEGGSPYLAPGTPAPAFTFDKYGGGHVSLAELKGKVVMLDFWATWCPPCIEEMPSLVKLAKEYEPKGVVFVAASRDSPPNEKAAVGVFIARRVPELAPFASFADDAATMKYKVVSLPTLYFIDRQGRVVQANSGFATEGQLRQRLENALAR